MNCSVIILAWQDAEMTAKCADSMGDDVEIVIVDNGSDDRYAQVLKDVCRRPNRQYVRCSRNLGYAGGMNVGLARATRDVVVFSNNDVIASPATLGALVDVCLSPRVGAAFPVIESQDRSTSVPAGYFLSLRRAMGMAVGLNLVAGSAFGLEASPEKADWISGPFVAMRRLLAISVGGVPTHSFFYSEDYRLCWELRQRRLTCEVVDTVRIGHVDDASARKVWNQSEIAGKQTYELLRAAMDHQPGALRRRLLVWSFLFGTWWRKTLAPSPRREAIFDAALAARRSR